MGVETIDSNMTVTGDTASQILLAQEAPFDGKLVCMFEAGPVAVGLKSHQAAVSTTKQVPNNTIETSLLRYVTVYRATCSQ
jgi:hypothetical protein